jgi:hypothetical protein
MPDKFKPWDDLKSWEDMSQSEQMKSLRWDVQRLFATLHDLTLRLDHMQKGTPFIRKQKAATKMLDDEEEH